MHRPTHGYQTCIAKVSRSQNDFTATTKCDEGHSSGVCLCCNIDQQKSSSDYFVSAVLTNECNLAGKSEYCEVGESIHGLFKYQPPLRSGTIWVYANSTNTTCAISKKGEHMMGMDFACEHSPCEVNWTITDIPPECVFAEMQVNRIEFWVPSVAEHFAFSTAGSEKFTLGPPNVYNRSLEIEHDVTLGSTIQFTNQDYAQRKIPWIVVQNTSQLIECWWKRQYSFSDLRIVNVSSWGGCEFDQGDWIMKNTFGDMTSNLTLYYLSVYGIFGNDSQENENIWLNITNSPTNYNFFIKDYFNTSYYGNISRTNAPNTTFAYAGCTIPEVNLGNDSLITISAPNDLIYFDKLTVTGQDPELPLCANTEMKCGWFTDNNPIRNDMIILGRSCNITTPLPQRALCENYAGIPPDCVYGNESGGPLPEVECYSPWDVVTNENSINIYCAAEGNWCPENFQWWADKKRCEPNPGLCDYRWSSEGTIHGCETWNTSMPGFMNQPNWCLSDFDGDVLPEYDLEWESACCEFLRVPIMHDGNPDYYLFFSDEEIKIY